MPSRLSGWLTGDGFRKPFRLVAPELDIAREVATLDAMEEVITEGTRIAPGARRLFDLLPADRWES